MGLGKEDFIKLEKTKVFLLEQSYQFDLIEKSATKLVELETILDNYGLLTRDFKSKYEGLKDGLSKHKNDLSKYRNDLIEIGKLIDSVDEPATV